LRPAAQTLYNGGRYWMPTMVTFQLPSGVVVVVGRVVGGWVVVVVARVVLVVGPVVEVVEAVVVVVVPPPEVTPYGSATPGLGVKVPLAVTSLPAYI
jgi:hypothetical protein